VSISVGASPAALAARCSQCGTELAPTVLACPRCGALVHSERLRTLASDAGAAKANGDLRAESAAWQQALDLLPGESQQYSAISARVGDITRQLAAEGGDTAPAATAAPAGPWYKRSAALIGAVLVLALTKGKFLLLGLTKAKTLLSMFAFFGVYWSIFGWPFALGLVVTIYIHEMGHVYVLRKLGIEATAPMFIPGLGAFILSKRHIDDPSVDARVGLAGPIWGLGAGVAAWAVFIATKTPIWGAIAAVTAFINLFNLIPIWQLDGARGFHALSRWQRWAAVAAAVLAFGLTGQKMLLLVGAVGLFRAFGATVERGDNKALATYAALVFALAWLSTTYTAGLSR
jgi:Zn-dependent protease